MSAMPFVVRRTFRALVPVVCGPEVVRMGIEDEVVEGAGRFLQALPVHARGGLIAAALLLEAAPATRLRTLGRTFSTLPTEQAEAVFDEWWHARGPQKALAKLLKMVVAFAWCEHPKLKERIAFDPDRWIAKVARERLERFSAEIARHELETLAPDPLPRETTRG